MSNFISLFLLASLLSISFFSKAGQTDSEIIDNERNFERVQIKWVNPKKYTDIRPSNESRTRFKKHVFSQLEEHFEELSADLPEGQLLKIMVTNVDLAGRVEPGSFVGFPNGGGDIRIMRQIDIPRIQFEYTLTTDNGQIIRSETVKLKDMNYLMRSNHAFVSREAFGYEKRMLTEWFNNSLMES